MRFYSQIGQDRYLFDHYFAGRCGLTFVDVGAYDGETFSNTLFLEETLGWRGLCIEPLPGAFAKLEQRRTCRCIRAAVADYEGEARFLEVDAGPDQLMLSGLAAHYEAQHRVRLEQQAASVREISVPVFPFHKLVGDAGIDSIDYCSIDTEGSELTILKSIDFDRFKIGILSVENNYQNPEIHSLLAQRGYHREALFHGYDELYVRRDLARHRRDSSLSSVSVVIPSRLHKVTEHDKTDYLIRRAINSVVRQESETETKVEIIVGLDRGTSVPPELSETGFAVRFVSPEEGRPRNQASALNAAFKVARGSLLAILEDDDQWHPSRLRSALEVLKTHDFCSSTQREVAADGNHYWTNDNATPSGWVFHRHVWERIGPFDEAINFHIDNEWLGRLNESKFTRCHQVEGGFPIETDFIRQNRPQLYDLIGCLPQGSAVVQYPNIEPLVLRTSQPGSATASINQNAANAEISQSERTRIFARYGTRVF